MKLHDTSSTRQAGDVLLDRAAVASALGMSPAAILTSLCRGSFPLTPLRIGRRLRWRASDVQRFIATGQPDMPGPAAR